MTLELRVVSGARAGATERFDGPVVRVGRHPTSDLRFDLHDDRDVSARHAELRHADGAWTVHDLGSTNGTLVNGERVTTPRRLAAGDTIAFGARGPRVEVVLAAAAGTDTRIAAAVRRQTASLRRSMVLGAGALLALAAMGALLWQRQAARRPPEPARPAAAIDLAAIHDRNDAAIAMIASDLDGTVIAGTAFGVAPTGQLVTSRHVVRSAAGRPARRIRVIFANTTEWLPARLVRTSDRDDLALIQVEAPGRYPVVARVGGDSTPAAVGSPVATIGYPHAVDTPMEGAGLRVTARTTTTAGTVSKRLDDVLQIDSYAGKGSSGSPLFDARGEVAGVVYGGAPESNGRIVYAVPGSRLRAFLGGR